MSAEMNATAIVFINIHTNKWRQCLIITPARIFLPGIVSGTGTYKFYMPDIETQQVAFIGTARELAAGIEGQIPLVAVTICLKIVNDKINEAG
jgi:hypothetical protein